MNLLTITGSPGKNGNTAKVLGLLEKSAAPGGMFLPIRFP